MGGAVSSGRMTTLIQTLKQEHCPLSHPIWLEISIDDMPNQYLGEEDIRNLITIKNKQPDNFSSLIRITIEVFSQASKISDIENSQNSKYINVCNFICLLLSISNDLDNNNDCNCWLKSPHISTTSIKPISCLMDTLQRLLRFNDPIQLFLQSSILDLRISYTKTLLFLIHAKSLGGKQYESDPSQFLLSFESFGWNRFLHELFEIIPIILSNKENNTISEKEQLLARSLITTAIPCLYSCTNWNIQQINVNLIQSSFSILKQYNNSKVISLSEQLVTFLFIVISNHPAFLDYLYSTNQIIEYITSLLYFYQVRFFENKRSSFFHKLILIIIRIFTSSPKPLTSLNEPFNGHFTIRGPQTVKIHKGTNADLIIEVTTNPLIFDSISIECLTSLVSGVILNLSETVTNLSFFSGNRLFMVLKKLVASGLFQKVQFENSVRNFLLSIFQTIKFNSKSNLSLFTMAAENERVLNFLSQIHHDKANYKKVPNKKSSMELASAILKIVQAASPALKIPNQKKRIEKFNELIEKVASEFKEGPEKAEKITIESFTEIRHAWFDWFRLLFWISFPKEARKAGLTFSTFELDSKGRGRDRISENQLRKNQRQENNEQKHETERLDDNAMMKEVKNGQSEEEHIIHSEEKRQAVKMSDDTEKQEEANQEVKNGQSEEGQIIHSEEKQVAKISDDTEKQEETQGKADQEVKNGQSEEGQIIHSEEKQAAKMSVDTEKQEESVKEVKVCQSEDQNDPREEEMAPQIQHQEIHENEDTNNQSEHKPMENEDSLNNESLIGKNQAEVVEQNESETQQITKEKE